MPEAFYLNLSGDVIAMCEEIVARAAEWHLPIKRKENFVGFGKTHGFYMFWFARKDGVDYFKARRTYSYEQAEEPVCYPLAAENKEQIFVAIEHIYAEYLLHREEFPAKKEREKKRRESVASPWSEVAERVVLSRSESQETAIGMEDASEFAYLADVQLEALLCAVADRPTRKKEKAIWEKYVLCDANTLRDVAPEYGVTHERIRQIVNKFCKRAERFFQERCLHTDDTAFVERNARMTELLEGLNGALIPFLYAGFADWGARKREFVLRLLFGKENGAILWKECESYRENVVEPAQKQKVILQKVEQLQALCQYPTEVYAETEGQISGFPKEREYTCVASFRKRLEKLCEHLRFVQNPNIVYYFSSKTDHRPDFLLEFENGRRVLVLVLPVFNMAYAHNRTRFRALHAFCEKKGYGYLVVDDRGQTPWELRQLILEEALVGALDEILLKNGRILWTDISELKKSYKVTSAMIAAYVLQKDLCFSMEPYLYICRFRNKEDNDE